LRALGLQILAHFSGQVVIHDVLEVDLVEVVSPWVQHGEALVLNFLRAVLLDVLLEELELGFVGVDGVAEVIVIDLLLVVTDERSDGLDAGA